MKRTLLLIGLCAAGLAQAGVQTAWVNPPGGVAVARDAADNVLTATWDYNPAGDILVAKRNSSGVLQWEVRYDNTDTTKHEMATWVAADSAGNVLVSGTLRSGYSSPVNANSILMKFSPTGQLLWRRVYEGFFDGSSTKRVLVDAQNAVYVLGLGSGPAGMVSTVKKFAPDGTTLWSWFDTAGIGAPLLFKLTPDGQLLISGRGIYGSVNGYAKVSTAGQPIWSAAGVLSLTAGDAAGDADGNSYLINGNYTAGTGSVLRKVSPTGVVLWERTHPMSGFFVEVGPDGAPVVSGFPATGLGGAAFIKYTPSGELLWENQDADGPSVGLLAHAQLLMDTSGSAYLAAGAMTAMGVTKVRADGVADWTALIPGSGYASSIALGSVGQVYVTGGVTARLDQDLPPPPPQADLALTLVDAPDPVKVRGELVYTATLRNRGTAPATGVKYQQVLPTNVTWVGSAPSQGSCYGSRTVNCYLGVIAPGAAATLSLRVQPRARGLLPASATVTTTAADADPSNNTASVSTTVTR